MVEMQPSSGNRVIQYLMKHNPSMITAPPLSNELSEATAMHYNSVLAWEAQNAGLSYPYGYPSHYDTTGPRTVPSDGVPVSQNVRRMEQYYPNTHSSVPAQPRGVESITTHVINTPASQQSWGTEAAYSHGHSSALAPRNGVQSHSYPVVFPERMNNDSNVRLLCSPESQPQITNGNGKGSATASFHNDIQEVSRQDWQAANDESSGRQVYEMPQSDVFSSFRNKNAPPLTSDLSVNPHSISQSCVQRNRSKAPSSRVQRSILNEPAPTNPQTTKKSLSKSQTSPVCGRVQKSKPSRGSRITPPPSRDQQPPLYVSGSGIGMTQEQVEHWEEERQNPYCLPSFQDVFGDVISTWPINREKEYHQSSSLPKRASNYPDDYHHT
ncbi:hypothetical protein V8C37DRAFT_404283 [Trichoderma ceciliae]